MGFYGVYSNGHTGGAQYDNCLRPCILLATDVIKIISGDGKTPGTAYMIGKQ